jgi:replication factor A1
MSYEELIDDVHGTVLDVVDNVERSEIADKVNELDGYGLPDDELERSVLRYVADENDVDADAFFGDSGGNEEHSVSEVKDLGEGEWVTLNVTFDTEWDVSHEAMQQTGLLGDETGRIKFTSWLDSDAPKLEQGESYQIDNVVTDEYNGDINIKFTKNTEVSQLSDSVEVSTGGEEVSVRGAFVDIQNGSGLIKRCPEDDCTRVLQGGRCSEHGSDLEGEFDLRIKGVVDDGNDVHRVIFNREKTEALTGKGLDEAKEMAMEALDTDVVAEEMREDTLGRYYDIDGSKSGRYVLVDTFEEVSESPDITELLNEVTA